MYTPVAGSSVVSPFASAANWRSEAPCMRWVTVLQTSAVVPMRLHASWPPVSSQQSPRQRSVISARTTCRGAAGQGCAE